MVIFPVTLNDPDYPKPGHIWFHFLGRLLRVDLIKWVSNVRPPVLTIEIYNLWSEFGRLWAVARSVASL